MQVIKHGDFENTSSKIYIKADKSTLKLFLLIKSLMAVLLLFSWDNSACKLTQQSKWVIMSFLGESEFDMEERLWYKIEQVK